LTFIYKFSLIFLFILTPLSFLFSDNFVVKGKVESIYGSDKVVVLMKEKPKFSEYLIVKKKNKIMGTLSILAIYPSTSNKNYVRVLSKYSLLSNVSKKELFPGLVIVLKQKNKKIKRKGEYFYSETNVVKKTIVSSIDNRQMILIPAGKFIFGSNRGAKNERTAKKIFLKGFYIDKFEVSNLDYYKYILDSGESSPKSWKAGIFPENIKNLPVYVTYYEAKKYAKWCQKRLPSEQEWEKAARGSVEINLKNNNYRVFPWGNNFFYEKANFVDFWTNQKKNEKPHLLSINSFKTGASPYGVINLSGNVAEWTSSWYKAHKGNYIKDFKYGTFYKVVKGGAFYSSKKEIRISYRQVAGLPNLYEDNLYGFRCVKDL